MNQNQFEKLAEMSESPKKVSIQDLLNKEERTLLYGYTCDRDTFHIYLRSGELHKIIFKHNEHKPSVHKHGQELPLEGIVPNKRLYPEACDFEFCVLLSSVGINLPFTTFDESREKKKFYTQVVQPSGNLSAWESCK
jgi:hypothetical protein